MARRRDAPPGGRQAMQAREGRTGAGAGPRPGLRPLALALLVAASSLPWPEAAAGHGVVVLPYQDPVGGYYGSAVWAGDAAYVFAGGAAAGVFRPGIGAERLNSTIPGGIGTAAVWDGQHAYIFRCAVYRFTPSTGEVRTMSTHYGNLVSSVCEGPAAVWNGSAAFVFDNGNIIRYDTASDTATVMGAKTAAVMYASAVWDGRYAYLFGGDDTIASSPGQYAHITRYDPAMDTVRVMQARLPTPRGYASAAWDGRYAYVFGGADASGYLDEVVRFDPVRDVAEVVARLPSKRVATAAASDGFSAYIFGGPTAVLRYTRNERPVPVIAPVPDGECIGGRATLALDGSASTDANADTLTFAWSAPGIAFDDAAAPRPTASFPFGTTTVELRVSDGELDATARVDVRVVDTLPPTVDLLRPVEGHIYLLDEVKVPHAKHHGQATQALAVGPLTVIAKASDQCGLVSVSFRASDGEQALDPNPQGTSSFLLNPAVPFAGNMTLQATALDLGGRAITDSITYLHVATDPMPVAMGACTFLFRAPDCADLRAFLDSVLAGARSPQGAEDLCRLLLGGTVCDEFTGK